ncbi:cellulose binding domain-containing protein [Nonomuraea angiospora]
MTVLLHIGTNDMYQNPNGASSRLATLIDRITGTAPAAEVFVATIIPLNGADPTVRGFNSALPGSLEGTPTPTPPGQGGACTATYRTTNTWSGGFQAEVTVRNNGSAPLNGWTVGMTLPAGQAVTNLWGGIATGAGGAISVRNASYNGTLAAGGTTTFGHVAGGNGADAPTGIGCSSP